VHALFSAVMTYKHDIKCRQKKDAHDRLLFGSSFSPNITLLSNRELGALALRQRQPWLGALADDEDIRYPNYRTF